MVRSRPMVFAIVAAVLASCTHTSREQADRHVADRGSMPALVPVAHEPILVLGSGAGVTVVDASTGSIRWSGPGTPALSNPPTLVVAAPDGGSTIVNVRSSDTGRVVAHQRVGGRLSIRTVSADGDAVALMKPLPPGVSAWTPRPRASTDIVVAHPQSGVTPDRFHLTGNFEPEGFSPNDSVLYMIRYVPATAPVAYRVAQLELDNGHVYPVFGRTKSPVETMYGSRLMQVPAPSGTRLYTLYASQPPEYAKGYDSWQAKAGQEVAFVHTLSLEKGWATCVGLPKSLWGGKEADEALGISRDGASLYVVDVARGVVAVMNTSGLKVERTAGVDFNTLAHTSGQVHAVVSADGASLYVARGSRIVRLDTSTLRPGSSLAVSQPVVGLGYGLRGSPLYLALAGAVEAVNPLTYRRLGMIRIPGLRQADYVVTLAA